MTILVCPLSRVAEMVETHAPDRVVSILDPEFVFPDLGDAFDGRHLRLRFHDLHEPAEGHVMPGPEHMRELLKFLGSWRPPDPLLVHCRAGIGRSTATAFIAACLANPDVAESRIAGALHRAAPLARPNVTWTGLADEAMGRAGRMTAAIEDMRRGLPWIDVDEGEPFDLSSSFRLTEPW